MTTTKEEKKEDKKEMWDINKLTEWKDNPRKVTDEGLERLKFQIKKLGQYKPLLVTDRGEVLGGNMRLRVYRELGIKDVWVSVVKPKDENEKIEYALSDNDRIGQYDEDMLSKMLPNYNIDLGQFSVDLKDPVVLRDFVIDPSIIDDIGLPDGAKVGFAQMTFTVTQDQADLIKKALEDAKALGDFGDTGNDNSNGNALARIAEQFTETNG